MSRARVKIASPYPAPVGLVLTRFEHGPLWWRDYESECLDWWAAFVSHPATTELAMAAVLRAIFVPHGDPLLPLCAIEPERLRPFLSPHKRR